MKKINEKAKVDKTGKASKAKQSKTLTLASILDMADKAYTSLTRKYYDLGRAYVLALDHYGSTGRKAFKARFPLTENALRNLELIGRDRLLPQFAMCSNRFTVGLVGIDHSLDWQYKLLGSSKNGYIRVCRGGKIVDKKFSDFIRKDEDTVLSIVGKADKNMSTDELAKKISGMMEKAREEFRKRYAPRPKYKIVEKDGAVAVRFFKSTPCSAEDLINILEEMKKVSAEKKATV